MPNYLYRLARLAFQTNDTFTIPGSEAQNAAAVLSARLPTFSGGQSTIVFATTTGTAKGHRSGRQGGDRVGHDQARVDSAGLRGHETPSRATWCRGAARSRWGRGSGRHRQPP